MLMAIGLWLTWPGARIHQTSGGVRRTQSCLGNLSHIAMAFAQYAQDYDGKFPRGLDCEDRFNPATWQHAYGGKYRQDARTAPMLHDLLLPYGLDRRIWRCPDDDGWLQSNLPGFNGGLVNVRPSAWEKYGTSYSYLTIRGFAGLRPADFSDPGRSISLFDGSLWHKIGGEDSVNALFADGHVQNLTPPRFNELMQSDTAQTGEILRRLGHREW